MPETVTPASEAMKALDEAIAVCGSAAALASSINISGSLPTMWKQRGKVPAQHCPAIERATRAIDPSRAVTCERLCPDVEWSVLREQPAAAVGQVSG